jgi:hypothetical protein
MLIGAHPLPLGNGGTNSWPLPRGTLSCVTRYWISVVVAMSEKCPSYNSGLRSPHLEHHEPGAIASCRAGQSSLDSRDDGNDHTSQ